MEKNFTKYIFVDFDNLNSLELSQIDPDKHKVFMLVPNSLNRLPYEVVTQAHKLESSLVWVKLEGAGKQDMDFHFSFLLGECNREAKEDVEFLIFSKDKDFSQKIRFIKTLGRKCRKIKDLSAGEIENERKTASINEDYFTEEEPAKLRYDDANEKSDLVPAGINGSLNSI